MSTSAAGINVCGHVCLYHLFVSAGTPSGAGVVPVVLDGCPTGRVGPLGGGSSSSGGSAGGGSGSVVVIESSASADGSRVELLRSLCQVVNTTALTLEVSLRCALSCCAACAGRSTAPH